jgi:mannose-6-phosphate isomerase-like protein (cupin superfamily)
MLASVTRGLSGDIPLTKSSVYMKETPRRVEKPWGHELIWAETNEYVGKILHVKAGEALSLQYHRVKDETLHLLTGKIRFWVGPLGAELAEVELTEGESIRIRPETVHRIQAIADSDVLEASTAHLGDVVRLEDRYGRLAPGGDAGAGR